MSRIKRLWEILKGWLTKDLFASPKPPFRPHPGRVGLHEPSPPTRAREQDSQVGLHEPSPPTRAREQDSQVGLHEQIPPTRAREQDSQVGLNEPSPPTRAREEGSIETKVGVTGKVEPFDLPVQNQTARTPLHATPPAKVQLSSPFLLGLDDLTDLETYSNDKFLELMTWNCVSQTSSDTISVTSRSSDGLSAPDILSTEDLLKTVKWDLEAAPSSTPEPSQNLAACFLLGLEDVPLEKLLTKNLLELIKWEGDNQTILPVQAEDLSLLEDLLGNFPE